MADKGSGEIKYPNDKNIPNYDLHSKEKKPLDASKGQISPENKNSDPEKLGASSTHKPQDFLKASIFESRGQNKELQFLFDRLGLDLPPEVTKELEKNATKELEENKNLQRKADELGVDLTPEVTKKLRTEATQKLGSGSSEHDSVPKDLPPAYDSLPSSYASLDHSQQLESEATQIRPKESPKDDFVLNAEPEMGEPPPKDDFVLNAEPEMGEPPPPYDFVLNAEPKMGEPPPPYDFVHSQQLESEATQIRPKESSKYDFVLKVEPAEEESPPSYASLDHSQKPNFDATQIREIKQQVIPIPEDSKKARIKRERVLESPQRLML